MTAGRVSHKDANERLFVGHSGRIFVVLTLGSAITLLGKQLIPVLLPTIIPVLEITAFEAGVALTAMELGYALLQYPSGRYSDHLTRKTVLFVALGTVLSGYAVLVGTVTYPLFLLGVVFIGGGHGLFAPVSRALLSELFVSKRGKAIGTYMMAGDVAGTIAASLAVVVVAVATWNAAFLPLIALLLAVLILLQLWSRERFVLSRVSLDVRETGARLFESARIRLLIVAYSLYVFTIRGFVGFLPTFLHTDQNFSLSLASTAFATLFVVGIVAKPLAGKISDVLPRTVVAAGALSFAVVGIGALLAAPSVPLVFAGVVVYAVGHKSFGPVMQAYLLDIFPDASKGGDLGATRTVYIGFGSLGPMYVGFTSGVLGYSAAFAGFLVCLLVAGGFVLAIDRGDRAAR